LSRCAKTSRIWNAAQRSGRDNRRAMTKSSSEGSNPVSQGVARATARPCSTMPGSSDWMA
jgi:hypothetical protein